MNRLKDAGLLHDPAVKVNDKRKEVTDCHGYKLTTGYHEYFSLLQLWKK